MRKYLTYPFIPKSSEQSFSLYKAELMYPWASHLHINNFTSSSADQITIQPAYLSFRNKRSTYCSFNRVVSVITVNYRLSQEYNIVA